MEEQFNNELTKFYKRIVELGSSTNEISGIKTGFHSFDKLTSGLQNGNLITIAAAPSMGSTSLALSMVRNISVTSKIPSMFISLSMTEREVVSRMVVNVCDIHAEKIKNGQLAPYEWGALDGRISELYDSPIYILSEPFMYVDKLIEDIRIAVLENEIKIVFIDYLQRMYVESGYTENRYLEMNYFTRVLKSIALELDIPIVVLSQINRNIDYREGIDSKKPILSDLRDSGTIEGDSDMVCFIYRPECYNIYSDDKGNDLRGMAEIIIAKHRNGIPGSILLQFKPEYGRFENLPYENLPMPGGENKQP